MSRPLLAATLVIGLTLAIPGSAAAHLSLTSPPSRTGGDVLKEPPCGRTGSVRSSNVTTYAPGETIEVVWDEYVDHPGHYRIAFDPDGDDDLADPACLAGCDGSAPDIETNTAGVMVLVDDIPDRAVGGGDSTYRVSVTLPDIECDNCTLQVIQVMYDKPPQTRPGNDIYYQCSDLVLSRSAAATDAGPGGATDAGPASETGGGGCAVRSGSGAGGSLLALLALLYALRRRADPRRLPR